MRKLQGESLKNSSSEGQEPSRGSISGFFFKEIVYADSSLYFFSRQCLID